MIQVTRPYLPPIEDYSEFLKGIWQRNWLTNNGPLVNELEVRLKEYLNLKHLLYTSNGTVALQIAIKALNLRGKIITTPFSYVATTSSIVWEGCRAVFVDIDEGTLNIDPLLIERAIDSETSAILATHCFGNACDIDAIQRIAEKHNLKVIYDAAHCFGSQYHGQSLLSFGDISTSSFHSTKLFHTVEGGSLVTKQAELLKKMVYMRNFGHAGPETFDGVGINGKNSEFHAAMGLSNLKYIDNIVSRRKQQFFYYEERLARLDVKKQEIQKGCTPNYSYYPIIFKSEAELELAKNALERQNIFPRRYFYPTLSSLSYVEPYDTPIANSVACRILCLPLYHNLSKEEQDMVARILLRTQNYKG